MIDRRQQLRTLLSSHRTAEQAEIRHLDAFQRLLDAEGDPFSRDHFVPGHVTASAFIVHPASGRLLLHHHKRLGRWLQMGGHLDPGEAVAEAALREAREESGLTDLTLHSGLPFDIDVHHIPAGRNEPPHAHFDVRFLVLTSEPESTRLDPDESLDLCWFSFDEAERAMSADESTRSIRKIRALF